MKPHKTEIVSLLQINVHINCNINNNMLQSNSNIVHKCPLKPIPIVQFSVTLIPLALMHLLCL